MKQQKRLYWRLSCFLVLPLVLLMSCAGSKPDSPDPQVVLSILRHYPQANLIEERLIKDEGDRVYQISHEAYTRLDLVIAYYDPLLKQLGFEQGPDPNRTTRTIDGFPVVYIWYYYGCPYHSIQIAMTAGRLLTMYGTGPCR